MGLLQPIRQHKNETIPTRSAPRRNRSTDRFWWPYRHGRPNRRRLLLVWKIVQIWLKYQRCSLLAWHTIHGEDRPMRFLSLLRESPPRRIFDIAAIAREALGGPDPRRRTLSKKYSSPSSQPPTVGRRRSAGEDTAAAELHQASVMATSPGMPPGKSIISARSR